MRVPFAQRGTRYQQADIDAVTQLMSASPTDNKWAPIRGFERDWCAHFDVPHALAVSSCTAALHLAIRALGLGAGDTVLVTPWTWVATGNVLLLEGVKPIFVDIEPDSKNMNIGQARALVRPDTKAMMLVHFAGYPAQLDQARALCDEFNLTLIQDAAHAAGAGLAGRPIEAWGDVICYSFYTQKNISTLGEGGMIACHDAYLYEELCLLQNHGVRYLNKEQDPRLMAKPWLRDCQVPGFNYRMGEMAAAVGRTQLGVLEELIAERKLIAEQYLERLDKVSGIRLPAYQQGYCSSWHLFVIDVISCERDTVFKALLDRGVQCNVHYTPLYHFAPFRPYIIAKSDYPVSESCYDTALSLPLYPGLTNEQIEFVVSSLIEVIDE